MGQYLTTLSATTNSSGGTEDSFIDITPNTSRIVRIVRITVTVNTASDDSRYNLKVIRKSAQGSGSVAGTIVKKDPVMSATATSTTQVKNGTSTFAAGTAVDLIMSPNFNGRAGYEWVARDEQDMIVSNVAQIVGLNIICDQASKVVNCRIEWRE